METLNIIFQALGALVVLWMIAVALVALFNVLGNVLLALAFNLGQLVERVSLGTIHVVNTAGVYDRPVVVARGGVRQPAEQPRQEKPQQQKQEQPKQANQGQPHNGQQAKPQQQQQQQQQQKPAENPPRNEQPKPQAQAQQPQQAQHHDNGMQKVWQRIQQLENEVKSLRKSGSEGDTEQLVQITTKVLDKLEALDERMGELEANYDVVTRDLDDRLSDLRERLDAYGV